MDKIYSLLNVGLEREIDNMPYSVSKTVFNRLIDKSLKRVIKKVGHKCGLKDIDIEGVKNLFWECNMSFPDFDDECYLSVMRGAGASSIRMMGSYERIDNTGRNDLSEYHNDILFNRDWGANYNSEKREMLGGYSEDGVSFSPLFRISDIDEELVPNAIAICSLLFPSHGLINAPYDSLQKDFGNYLKETEAEAEFAS